MCGKSCYATCDDENPTCDDTCTPTCNCIDGFVKSSDDGECIPMEECKNVVDLTCGDNEELVNSLDPCYDTCEQARLDSERPDCIKNDPNVTFFAGCRCLPGFVRLNAYQYATCVPESECSAAPVNEYERFDFFRLLLEDDLPLKANPINIRTYGQLIKDLDFTSVFDELYVLGLKEIDLFYVFEDNSWAIKRMFAVQLQFVTDGSVNGPMADFVDEIESAGYLTQDFVFEWDREFEDMRDENGYHFPCYNRECDDENLGCDRVSEFIGCPEDQGKTCTEAQGTISKILFRNFREFARKTPLCPLRFNIRREISPCKPKFG